MTHWEGWRVAIEWGLVLLILIAAAWVVIEGFAWVFVEVFTIGGLVDGRP